MQMTIRECVIDVDVEATRAYYASAPVLLVPCNCPGCRNFQRAVNHLPQGARTLLESLGVDPLNPAEQWCMCTENGGRAVVYNVFWHLCGRIVSGEETPDPPMPGESAYACGVSALCGLVHDDFPRPVVQLDMNVRLPWLLDEPFTY